MLSATSSAQHRCERKTNLKETVECIRIHIDDISGSKTLLLIWVINFCENHAVLPNTYCTHHWRPFVLKPFLRSTKAAFHSQMKFLSNSCQREGNEATTFISPRGIAGLSLELMMQCLFTVELPLNKKGRKRFFLFRLHPPCTSHLLYRRCLEKQHSLFNIYAQCKAPQRLVQRESSRNTTKTAQITIKMNGKSSCGPQKEESHPIWDFHKVQVPRLLPNPSPAFSKKALSSTASKLLLDEAEKKFHKETPQTLKPVSSGSLPWHRCMANCCYRLLFMKGYKKVSHFYLTSYFHETSRS